jgi:hypothetical protein
MRRLRRRIAATAVASVLLRNLAATGGSVSPQNTETPHTILRLHTAFLSALGAGTMDA